MVGQLPLEQLIGVRVPDPQLGKIKTDACRRFFSYPLRVRDSKAGAYVFPAGKIARPCPDRSRTEVRLRVEGESPYTDPQPIV